MTERPQPEPVPVEDPPPHPVEPVKLETPVIELPELKLKPRLADRLAHKGERVAPSMDGTGHDHKKEDEEAINAMERLERSMKEHA
jgi:hypothetical protein